MAYIPKKRQKQLVERIFKKLFFKYFIPFCVFFILSIFFFNANFMKINKILISGNKYENKEKIKEIIKNEIDGKYFGIYNKNNFLFYPKEKIILNILEKKKRISKIEISYSNFFRHLNLKIIEKKPKYLFCESKDCFFVEEDGSIFTEYKENKTEIKKEDFLVFKDLFNNIENKKNNIILGKKIFNKEIFKKIQILIEDFKKYGLFIFKVIRSSDGNFIFYTNSLKKIIIKYNQDFSKIIRTLKILSQKKIFKIDKFKKDFTSNIIYIDLTYGDYIFYCKENSICRKNYTY